jgi:hypothetical protein
MKFDWMNYKTIKTCFGLYDTGSLGIAVIFPHFGAKKCILAKNIPIYGGYHGNSQ